MSSFSWLSNTSNNQQQQQPSSTAPNSTTTSNNNNNNNSVFHNNNNSSNNSTTIAANSYLRYATVDQVSNYRGSDDLARVLKNLQHYDSTPPTSSVMRRTDPEYDFILECGNVCVKIEQEKLKIHKFIVDHYARRFPELIVLVQDATTFARVVSILGNNILEMDKVMEQLEEWIPSQLLAALIACTVTTKGQELPAGDMDNILAACHEMTSLEEVKQVLLEYIQVKMIYVCRNICAFLGPGIASQLVATAGSVDELANLTIEELTELGSVRAQKIGFAIKTSGFLSNVDLVQKQPAELRTKASRLVAGQVSRLAKVDAKREGADESQGLQGRDYVIRKILEWTDPVIQDERRKKHGLSNKLYERKTRISKKDRWAQAAANTTSVQQQNNNNNNHDNRESGARRQRE